jgi:hypothetical protein
VVRNLHCAVSRTQSCRLANSGVHLPPGHREESIPDASKEPSSSMVSAEILSNTRQALTCRYGLHRAERTTRSDLRIRWPVVRPISKVTLAGSPVPGVMAKQHRPRRLVADVGSDHPVCHRPGLARSLTWSTADGMISDAGMRDAPTLARSRGRDRTTRAGPNLALVRRWQHG